MFGALTDKLQAAFSGLMGKKTLTEENISEAVRQIRLALLDADVNYSVVGDFLKRVKEKAVGDAVAYMAGLPLDANVLFMTVMATKMPFVGRG